MIITKTKKQKIKIRGNNIYTWNSNQGSEFFFFSDRQTMSFWVLATRIKVTTKLKLIPKKNVVQALLPSSNAGLVWFDSVRSGSCGFCWFRH